MWEVRTAMTSNTPFAITVIQVPIDELRPDPANPRRISDAQLEALTKSLKEYGFVQPVLARLEDKTVIGGHQRLTAARRLGYKTVPVIFLDITLEQARLLNLSLNKISGEWDQELLARMLADLAPAEGIDLSLSGFSDDELKKLLKSLEARDKKDRMEDFDFEEALKRAQSEPRAQRGEIWLLGDHRLMCGDSTDVEDVDRLFAGEKAALLATDPPYLVDYTATNHPESISSTSSSTSTISVSLVAIIVASPSRLVAGPPGASTYITPADPDSNDLSEILSIFLLAWLRDRGPKASRPWRPG